ncbi:protein of unknown function [Burkholderia multivorans]
MGDLLKVALVIAVLWGIDEWRDFNERTDDFFKCNDQAARAIAEGHGSAQIALLLPPGLSEHDQIDELIQRCMAARDYDYVPSGWEHCPTEKLPGCYHKPSWGAQVYRLARDIIPTLTK